jgi:cyclic dehypoxanthinyl futalosine synthase
MVRPADEILRRTRAGERLAPAEALVLLESAPLEALGAAAHEARLRASDPGTVTYLVDRNVNYTNVCVTNCLFCAFWRPLGHPEAYVLAPDDLAAKVADLAAIGGTRVLLQGGHHPDLRLPFYRTMLSSLKARFPAIALDAFSPSEVDHLARLEGRSIEEVLRELVSAGLDGLPGGGAEILDDEVRSRIARKKQSADGWLSTMEVAQRLGLTTSATMVIGFGETPARRVRHLGRLRDLQDRSIAEHGNGFTAFISWTFQPEHTPLGKAAAKRGESLGAGPAEYLRTAALSRLFLDNFAHHQASWPTQGREVARRALRFGCDDFGSTMMEENVVSSAGSIHPAMDVESIRAEIRLAGFTPAQRDSRYRRFPPVPGTFFPQAPAAPPPPPHG